MVGEIDYRYSNFMDHYFNMVEFSQEIPRIKNLLDKISDREERHLILSNIPAKYWKFEKDKILDDFLQQKKGKLREGVKLIQNYINKLPDMLDKGIGLYLEGPSGTSKTTISIIILREALKLRYRVFFCPTGELIEFVTRGWKSEAFKQWWKYVVDSVDFLVIDDVGRDLILDKKEKIFLDRLFVDRSNLKLPVILTSNVSKDEAEEIFSTSLYSLFKELLCTVKLDRTDVRDDYEKINKKIILG